MDHKKRGKQNRAIGSDTERRVKKDLEKDGWIVSKWNNNIKDNKLVVVKNKFRGVGIPMMLGAGFPDFLVYRSKEKFYEVIGVECKTNGYLDKEEKEKCAWLLENGVFSRILIASREKINNRIKINYKTFGEKKNE